MKKGLLIITGMICFIISSWSQQPLTVYDQLCALNSQWKTNKPDYAVLNERILLSTDQEMIKMHLTLVENTLRNKDISHLTPDQKEKRMQGLAILHNYCKRGVFPVNLYHSERTPYFIDYLGTACAVGQIVIETGFGDFAEQIKNENNYGYIFDLENKYPLLTEWAYTHGFTMEELAWIQPTYGGGCTSSNFGYATGTSCSGTCDGMVVLQTPMGGTPPYTISGPGCTGLCPGTYTYSIIDAVGNTTYQIYTINSPSPVVASASMFSDESAPGNCDGSATSSVTGGTGPYTFYWFDCSTGTPLALTSQNINGLCAGTYYVVITDANGCSDISNCITISSAGCNMVSTYSTTDVLCYGDCNGSVTITTTGGTPPYTVSDPTGGFYTYNSTVTINNLCAGTGTYITEDASGCQEFLTITIYQPALLTLSNIVVTPDAGSCTGGVSFNVYGGTPAYTFYDGFGNYTYPFNNVCAGDSVQPCVMDANACVACGPVAYVTPPCNMTSGITNSANASCYGLCDGTASVLTTNGNPPYVITGPFIPTSLTYSSVVTVNNLCVGTWTYTITDAVNCTNYVVVTITQPTEIIATAIWNADASGPGSCDGVATGSFTGGTSSFTYQWIDCNSGLPVSSTAQNNNTLCAGDYSFVVTDANGCSDTSACITVSEPTGFGEINHDFDFVIFPNPSDGLITILLNGSTGTSTGTLTDITGKKLMSFELGNNYQLNTESLDLKNGIYFIIIENNSVIRKDKILIIR